MVVGHDVVQVEGASSRLGENGHSASGVAVVGLAADQELEAPAGKDTLEPVLGRALERPDEVHMTGQAFGSYRGEGVRHGPNGPRAQVPAQGGVSSALVGFL